MKALVVTIPGQRRVVDDAPIPRPGDGEVQQIEVKAVGICGSDLHILAGEFPPTSYPITPGQEFAGVVTEEGAGVVNVQVDERAAVDPSLSAGGAGTAALGASPAPVMSMLESGVIDVERMVTHRFPLEQFDEGLATMRARQGLKIQVTFE